MEREDWMTKAMPKATPGAAQESAEQQKEEPAKKVILLAHADFRYCDGRVVSAHAKKKEKEKQQYI